METAIKTDIVNERLKALRLICQDNLLQTHAELGERERELFNVRDGGSSQLVARLSRQMSYLTPTSELEAATNALGLDITGLSLIDRRRELLSRRLGRSWDLTDMQALEIEESRGLYAIAVSYDLVERISGLIRDVESATLSTKSGLTEHGQRMLTDAIKRARNYNE